jgi:hypothetical protein
VKKHPAVLQYMRLTPLLCLLLIPERAFAAPLGLTYTWWDVPYWPLAEQRAAIAKRLEALPGSHLVIVQYRPEHSSHQEWVYNRADIDHAKVVWARHIDEDCDQRLVKYFKDRAIWLLEPDENPPQLRRVSGSWDAEALCQKSMK